jgi:type IV secretion system protein VirB4
VIKLRRVLKDYQDSGALNALVSVHAAVDDHTFLTKGGDLFQVLRVTGMDYECMDPSQLDQVARRFESAIRTFDESFRFYQYLIKSDHAVPHGARYENAVVNEAIAGRIAYLQAKAETLYSLETYFAVVYEEPRQKASTRRALGDFLARPGEILGQMLSTEKKMRDLESHLSRNRQILEAKVTSFVIQLQDILAIETLDKHRAFSFLRRLLNYSPHVAEAGHLKYDTFVDFQACGSALECHRDHLRMDDYFIEVLTMKEEPGRTFAHLLKGLQEVPANYIIASEWRRIANTQARQIIQSIRRHFYNSRASVMNYVASGQASGPKDLLIDDSAVAVVSELGACLQELEVNGRYVGEFSTTVVVYGKNRTALARQVAECFKTFALHDAQLIQERYNLLNAWLAILPGNAAFNLRRLYLLNTNYADLSFLFAPHTGDREDKHLAAEYLAIFETAGGVPYFFNLHHRDLGHTFVLGATGSGKSFLLNFLLTHAQKYRPFTFIFDLGGSYEMLTRLFGGVYVAVGNAERPVTVNPFCLPPTAENLQFLYSFIRVLVESSGYQLRAADERDLYEQIENMYAIEPEQRRLYTLANIVNANLRPALQKWVEGGQYGAWFDHTEDTLTFSRFQAFDFEGVSKIPQVLEPLLFYILHRANASIYDPDLATTLKIFVMDEAWRFLRHATIKLYILEALKTWRKRNAAMILATQSSEDLAASQMLPVVLESCPTQLFLSNPGMDRKTYRDIFHLNETETERIAGLIPKREILIKRPDLSKVVSLNVDAKGYWLYTNNPYDNRKKREAFERYGFERGLEILAGRRGDQEGVPACN